METAYIKEENMMTLYHGSAKIMSNPQFGLGRERNDYGQGFYCTQQIELAREWSCQTIQDGYVSIYELNMKDLTIVNLTQAEYSILHWLALLNENRRPSITTAVGLEGAQFLHNNYLPNIQNADIIIGNRADDSYFSFVRSFLNNEITIEQLEEAMNLGELGLQVMIKSEKAFHQLTYRSFETVDGHIYFGRRKKRDEYARNSFVSKQNTRNTEGIYMIDLIREAKKNNACI